MRISYDPKADAMYIVVNDAQIARTEELEPGVMRDVTGDGQTVGIEVLSVSKRFGRTDQAGWTMNVPTSRVG